MAASFYGGGVVVVVGSLLCASDRGFPRTFLPTLLSSCACGSCWLSKMRPLAAAPALSCLSTLDERPVGAAADAALLRMRIANRFLGADYRRIRSSMNWRLPSTAAYTELRAVDFFVWAVGGSLPADVKSETFWKQIPELFVPRVGPYWCPSCDASELSLKLDRSLGFSGRRQRSCLTRKVMSNSPHRAHAGFSAFGPDAAPAESDVVGIRARRREHSTGCEADILLARHQAQTVAVHPGR